MNYFTKPAPDGRVDDKKEKYVSFRTNEDSKVVSPYNGIVFEIKQDSNKENEIIIKHEIEGETYFTGIGGVKTPKTFRGEKVYKNDIIGFSSSVIYFRIYDSSFKIVKNPYKILESGLSSLTDSESESSETDSGKEKKKEKEGLNTILPKSSKDRPALYQGALKAITAPLWLIGKAFEKDEKENLEEEIQRIKTLLK